MTSFTDAELDYLRSQRLGRLATLAPTGALQNSPTGFVVNDDGTIDIFGRQLAKTQKYRNVRSHDRVAFVVDDLASERPWTVRCLEIRGTAEALSGVEPPSGYFTHDAIRITPQKLISFGINGDDVPTVRTGAQ